VQPFPKPTASGKCPLAADGKELYFIAPDGKLMAAQSPARHSRRQLRL